MENSNQTLPAILIIDDDLFFRELIQEALPNYHITHNLGENIDPISSISNDFDLIILDINLGRQSGFDLCEAIRQSDSLTPILFVSSMTDLESRLTAYGVGGNDYITKPFQPQELGFKVNALIRYASHVQDMEETIQQTSELVLNTQREISSLHTINRFIFACNQSKNINDLYTIFLHALKELDSEGVLSIIGHEGKASHGTVSRLEQEIIDMSDQLPRIYRFGHDRALFNWSNATLLVRQVGPLIDILAILMDSLEIAINQIRGEQDLFHQVLSLESQIEQSKDHVENLVKEMAIQLNNELLNLGLVSSLSVEEEEYIQDILNKFQQKMQNQLLEHESFSHRLKDTLNKMQRGSESFEAFLTHIQHSADTTPGIELF